MNCLEYQDFYTMEVSVLRFELSKFVRGNNRSELLWVVGSLILTNIFTFIVTVRPLFSTASS